MSAAKPPVTPAIHVLRSEKVLFTPHLYKYEEKGGTAVSSRELNVEESRVIKTLVMETESKEPLIVLMHGDKQVSLKELARFIGVKQIAPCKPEVAQRLTGYQVGGTSPFGTKRALTIYMQQSILELDRIYINGGGRGFLVSLDPQELVRVLKPQLVDVATESSRDSSRESSRDSSKESSK